MRSCIRNASSFQNSIQTGLTRKPVQNSGRGILPTLNSAINLATRRSKIIGSSKTCDCLEAQAPSWLNLGRLAKYKSASASLTCSILPSEIQNQVHNFLTSDSGKDFIFVKDKKVLAHTSGFDGFYMALLERKN